MYGKKNILMVRKQEDIKPSTSRLSHIMNQKDFTQKIEKTTDFTFTTKSGKEVTLNVVRGRKMAAGKKKPFDYWQCELSINGMELKSNITASYDIDGYDEELQLYLSNEKAEPICYCKDDTGKTVGILIPTEIANLISEAIHEELTL